MMKVLSAAGLLVFTLVIYFGLPLLGWGILDLEGFLQEPARLGFAILVFLFAFFAFYQGLVIPSGGIGQKEDEGKVRKTESLLGHLGVVVFLVGGLILLGYSDRHAWLVMNGSSLLRFLGLFLLAAGGFFAFWSAMTLGRQYSTEITIQKDHRLITNGPYRLIRHPRYLGALGMALGYALLFSSYLGLGLTFLLLAAFVLRIKGEESMMRAEFGAEWENYSRHTWRLVPYIY
jgi:protein-S-isoprenylcysteine O-methyltransferase Ste14